jgi:DNA repair exonuclease SbcCD nuclease subunit
MVGLSAYEEAPLGRLQMATRHALANLVELAIEERVDLLLLAGDIFDGDWTHYGTGVHFIAEMARLREAEIPAVMIAGNHDAESKLTKALPFPENVHVLSTREPQSVIFENLGLAVHGQGYATPAVLDDLSAGYPRRREDLLNIGLLHTSADGRPGHERYAPCTAAGLDAHGYDYWGLGHVHRREVLKAETPILFPGNLQGRGLRETGAKGATLLQLDHDGHVSHEHRVLDVVRWELLSVDASGCASREEACQQVATRLREAAKDADGRLLAARIQITGVCQAHAQLLADGERLRYEIIAAATDVAGDTVWIEGVQTSTSPVCEIAGGGEDAIGELISELHELSDADALEALVPLAKILPAGVLEEFDPGNAETVRALLGEVAASLPVALLQQSVV